MARPTTERIAVRLLLIAAALVFLALFLVLPLAIVFQQALEKGLAAYVDPARKERRTVHAVGDGTFVVDGRKLDRRRMMASRLPAGV